ncbi:GlsB/YeaQ/YmgE family stress response membrane protein [Ktedonobacter robiniae]|uniref:Transglycosylase n=1 Tax=Ktedonobacter robiniae TaxID=2778365 RepID=A0ABQ3UFZ3_9CHLR|nr:GlsB/YeaQ/YmgE family stress response membrane protein [Ktedonobacter robiniae]GHO51631.1 transglycosylase [Ktedonobacter robiniae]
MVVATVLAASLNPGGIIAWLVVGLIAGFLAGRVMRGAGYGIVGDIVVGIIGAFLGGLVSNLLIPDANFGFWGSIVVSFIGACILIAILRAVSGGRRAL